jgi:hypothetical protein
LHTFPLLIARPQNLARFGFLYFSCESTNSISDQLVKEETPDDAIDVSTDWDTIESDADGLIDDGEDDTPLTRRQLRVLMSSGSRRAAATVLSEAEDEPDVQLSLSK